jgi:hypothetical protein
MDNEKKIKVENGIGRPVNNLDPFCHVRRCTLENCSCKRWDSFEQYAKENEFATDAKDGLFYKDSDFSKGWTEQLYDGKWERITSEWPVERIAEQDDVRWFRPCRIVGHLPTIPTPAPLSEQKQEGESLVAIASSYAYEQLRTEDKQDWADNELHEHYTDEYHLITDAYVDAYIAGQSQHTAKELAEKDKEYKEQINMYRDALKAQQKVITDIREQRDDYATRHTEIVTRLQAEINQLKAENERLNGQGFDD